MAMQQSRLERENLEAHVDLCAERYRVLEEKLNRLESKVDSLTNAMSKVAEKQTAATMSSNKLVIGAAATVIAGLLSTVVLLLLNLRYYIVHTIIHKKPNIFNGLFMCYINHHNTHHTHPNYNFGVTSLWVDKLFNTYKY